MTTTDLIDQCYQRSVALLKKNSHSGGVIAAARTAKSVDRNYASIFGRDAAICSLGMVASGDRELIRHAKKGLLTLAAYQAPNGQIPKYVKPEKREADFWYSGCIDATLWWLYAVDHFDRAVPSSDLKKRL
jgi:glycogen debranching enzyme